MVASLAVTSLLRRQPWFGKYIISLADAGPVKDPKAKPVQATSKVRWAKRILPPKPGRRAAPSVFGGQGHVLRPAKAHYLQFQQRGRTGTGSPHLQGTVRLVSPLIGTSANRN
jgi:hypothetical protein